MEHRKAAFHNLGCKVNAYEQEVMTELLEEAGYEIVPFAPGADVYVINTCTVTNIADRKSRQMLHRAKKMNPAAVVVAAGCYAQTGQEVLKKDEAIDIILGNNQKSLLPSILEDYFRSREKSLHVLPLGKVRTYEPMQVTRPGEKVRAFLKVTDGCNQFCSYCLIPYARGRVRSREAADVRKEVEKLAAGGCREVVLTGIHLSSYGTDFPPGKEMGLLDLIRDVHEVEGICRIRLGSLEPGIVTEEFAAGLAALPKVCPHFHLSLQSGCDTTLRNMNRRYTSREYRERCLLLRQHFILPALTTDIIAGFPGETEEDFETSLHFVEEVDFYETHIFKYSRREGTRAASMPDQVPEGEKTRRSDILLELNARRMREYEEAFLGREVEVLLEEEKEIDGKSFFLGHSREYIPVAVPKRSFLQVNDICSVTLSGYLSEHLLVSD